MKTSVQELVKEYIIDLDGLGHPQCGADAFAADLPISYPIGQALKS